MLKHGGRGVVWLVAVAALAFGGWWWSRPAPVEAKLVEVEAGVVEARVANTRGGTVNACRRARLAPAMGGTIEVLAAREGTVVEPRAWNRSVPCVLSECLLSSQRLAFVRKRL